MDLSHALAPKTDQIDATDLIGKPPQIFTIRSVSENGSELADQQPVNIRLEETGLYWRPSKGMLRVLAADDNWGRDVRAWVGRRVELYGDPNVYFGKEKRGGTRISRLSHISKKTTTLINPRGGRGAYWSVDPLPDAPTPPAANPNADLLAQIKTAAENAGVSLADVATEWAETHDGQPIKDATDIGGLELLRDDLIGRAK